MENQIQNSKSSEEIDLKEFISKTKQTIKQFFVWLNDQLISFILFVVRKFIWILAFSIIGGFIGYQLFINAPRCYYSEMIVRSNDLNCSVIVHSIDLLNDLTKNGNRSAIGTCLGITTQEAEEIKSVEAFYGIDINRDGYADYVDYGRTYSPRDTIQKKLNDIFYVRINVYDESVFTVVKTGVKKYLNTNPFVIENSRVRKLQSINLIEVYKKQIKKLDSLQKVHFLKDSELQLAKNYQMIHADIIKLYEKQLGLERQLALNPNPITVIQDFIPLAMDDILILNFFKKMVSVFVILGFFFSAIWQSRSKIWQIIRGKK